MKKAKHWREMPASSDCAMRRSRFHVLLLLLSLLCLSGCSSMNPLNWFDSSDTEPPAELIEIESSIPIKKLWTHSAGGGTNNERVKLIPFVIDGRLFVAQRNGVVKALDVETGRVVWSTDTDLPLSGGPGVGDGLVVVGTSNAKLVALDTESGEERWRVRVSSEILSVPKVASGIVVVHTIDGKIIGLDALDGTQAWLYNRSVPVLSLHGSSSPVISGDKAICGFANGKLAALDLVSGTLLWEAGITLPSGRTELERMVDIDATPLIMESVVYVATFQGELAAVSEATGVVLWRRKLSSHTGMAADWSRLYISDEADQVWAIDPDNGSALWKNNKLYRRQISAPAVIGEYVIIGDFEGYLHWLSREDGRILARTRVGKKPISSAPVVVDGVAYVYGDGGALAAVKGPES